MISPLPFSELCTLVRKKQLPIAVHSSEVTEGGVFVVMPAAVPRDQLATTPGGERFLAQAMAARPAAVLCEERHAPLVHASLAKDAFCSLVTTTRLRDDLGVLAQARYNTDTHCPAVVGITGTNGKTTESYLLEALFTAAGKKVGVIGTVNYRWPGVLEDAPLTTPGCLQLHSLLSRMYSAGVDVVFMEVSSHALDQQRVAGIPFCGALLTNVTQDHLDYHRTMDEYFAAKERLFVSPELGGVPLANKVCACNADDAYARRLLAKHPEYIGFGLKEAPVKGSRHLHGQVLSMTPEGLRLAMEFEGKRWELVSPLVGDFNAMNLLGAQAMGLAFGLSLETLQSLANFHGVPGRLERIVTNSGLNLFVDYAHTPDALMNALSALRAAGFERIVTVFGCGGNRDRSKRPLMGKAVAQYSDVAVLTSDNPRDEDPEAIMADVLPGLAGCGEVVKEADRRAALQKALALLGPKDALLVAGKGHETYQIIHGEKLPFSDQATLRELVS